MLWVEHFLAQALGFWEDFCYNPQEMSVENFLGKYSAVADLRETVQEIKEREGKRDKKHYERIQEKT